MKKILSILLCLSLFNTINAVSTSTNSNWVNMGDGEDYVNVLFDVALKQQNIDVLENIVLDISDPTNPNYGNYLPIDEILDLIQAKHEHYVLVKEWLDVHGVEYKYVGDAFRCRAPISTVNKLLNVKIQKYYHLTKHVLKYQTTDQYTLPEYLLNIVELIEGLHMNFNDRLSMVSGTYTSDPGYVSREVLQRLYSLEDALVRNKQVSAGAIEYNGGGFNETYLNTSQSLNDVLPRKVYKQIGLNFGGGIESTLDMDMLADTASNVELWYMNYQVWMYGIALDVFNSKEKPMVLSVSYGWAEWDQCSLIQCGNLTAAQYIKRANNEFLKLAATGVSVLVASGDAGAPGRTNEGCNTKHQINPVYPGSSPWVTSVGATFVVQDKSKHFNYTSPICQGDKCATGVQSKPVNFNDVQWTSGGGFSLESRPKWQNDYVNEYLKSGVHLPNNTLWNSKGRGYPDVVANGHNCPVYGAMGSGFCDVDGTSCSTPVVAAIVSLLNDYQVSRGRKQLGFLNPLLYQMKQDNPSSYGKVLPGNNACTEACCCGEDYGFTTPPKETHWNPVSGLGSPVFTEMKQYLDSLEDGQCIE